MSVVFGSALGCGGSSQTNIEVPKAQNNLRSLTKVYMDATEGLKRPPKNAEELKPYATKMGADVKELTSSPVDGAELAIQWGADIRALKSQDGKYPIWAYEKNPHSGKRWVVQSKYIAEMSEEEFKNTPLVPGMKRP